MTPLAARIAREATLPLRERTMTDGAGLLPRILGAHCFEATGVFKAAGELGEQFYHRPSLIGPLAFLPAPLTWIEWREADGRRVGFLLEDRPYEGRPFGARVDMAGVDQAGVILALPAGALAFAQALRPGKWFGGVQPISLEGKGLLRKDHVNGLTGQLYGLLAMINTPRVIGQRVHMPHAGLQRAIARSKGMVGRFPLRAWTEIVLEVTPPQHPEGEREIRLTGQKALHFVRCHLRIRLGQLELVSAHWRGDPALGIKRSRYAIVPPRDGRWPDLTPEL